MNKSASLKLFELLLRLRYGYSTRELVFVKPRLSLGLFNIKTRQYSSSSSRKPIQMLNSEFKKINILVQQLTEKDPIVEFVRKRVNPSNYIVYPVFQENLELSSWSSGCKLLILQENSSDSFVTGIDEYRNAGGQVIKIHELNSVTIGKALLDAEIDVIDESAPNLTTGSNSNGFFHSFSSEDFFLHDQIKKKLKNQTLSIGKFDLRFDEDDREVKDNDSTLFLRPGNQDSSFNFEQYSSHLQTRYIGRNIFHFHKISSTMDILGGASLLPGLVVLADQQTQGRGRGGNLWISPPGCAMFSLQLQLNLVTCIGAKPSLIQHIVGLAVAETLRSFHNDFEVRLKWPNDIYYKNQVKLGGVIANSSFLGSTIVVNIGCGVNLNNLEPTISVNNILSGLGLAPISREAYLSVLFNTLENLIDLYNQGNQDILFQRYYKYWLHENQEIKLEIELKNSQNKCSTGDIVKIVGLDEFGYLRVKDESGHEFSVHDDGNSFDMTKGLIRPKFS